jgi:phage-related holin
MKTFFINSYHTLLEKLEFIFGFLVVFVMSQKAAFLAVGSLIVFDFFTGIWASVKLEGWQSIQSRRMKDTITKFVMYNILIITCMVCEKYLVTRVPFIEVGLGIIATVESKSIFENIEKVLDIRIIRAFKDVLHRGKEAKKEKASKK